MRPLIVFMFALIVVPVAAAQPIQGGVHKLAQADAGVANYATSITKQQAAVGSLAYEERVTYGGIDVGGFSVTFTPNAGTPIKQFGIVIVRNIKTADLLDQQIDITYDGAVIAHATFKSTPPVAPDTIHGLDCQSWSENGAAVPMTFTCDLLPPA